MFCYQCETAAQGVGCDKVGICGKQPTTSDLQDLLIYAVKGVSFWAHQARQKDTRSNEIDRFVIEALFTTVTNVDFADDSIVTVIAKAVSMREKARELNACWEMDTSRARDDLGFESAIDFERGARHTFEWYIAEGWL